MPFSFLRLGASASNWPALGCVGVIAVTLATGCLSTAGGGGAGKDDCERGDEGCECFGNDTCLDDLSCRSGLCVDTSKKGSKSDDDGGSPSGSKPSTTTDEDATDDATDDTSTDDTTDDTTTDDTPTDPGPSEPSEPSEPAGTTDPGPAEPAVTTDPGPSEPAPEPDPGPAPGTACTEGTGSCSDGSGLDCQDGTLVARECSGCSLLSCGIACCNSVWPLTAESYPYERRDDLLTSFTTSANEATVSVAFTALEEFAAIGFTVATPQVIDLASFAFNASTTGTVKVEVSLELDGETGCIFSTSGGQLVKEIGCWGAWEDTGYGGSAERVLIRILSERAQTASLTVGGVTW